MKKPLIRSVCYPHRIADDIDMVATQACIIPLSVEYRQQEAVYSFDSSSPETIGLFTQEVRMQLGFVAVRPTKQHDLSTKRNVDLSELPSISAEKSRQISKRTRDAYAQLYRKG